MCDDLTDGAGRDDDCAVLCFQQALIFGFVIRTRCFCHLVNFFPTGFVSFLDSFGTDWGSGVLY